MKKKTKVHRKRKGITKILDLEDLHKIINKVQINNKEISFVIPDVKFVPTVENIVKDSTLFIRKKKYYRKEVYVLAPNGTEFCKEANVDEFEKELFSEKVAETE